MNYSEILSRAWQIIWKHKVLWIFGILAGCASGGGGGGGGNTNFSRDQQAPAQLQPYLDQAQTFFESIPPETWIMIAIGIGLLVLVLVVLGIFLGTIGKIGLIRGAQQADQDMEARLTFGELFKGSLPYFWRVFLLNLLVGLVFFVVAILSGSWRGPRRSAHARLDPHLSVTFALSVHPAGYRHQPGD